MNKNNYSKLADEIAFIKSTLHRPLVIVGMMGVGKSHVGSKLATALGFKFNDSDALIEKKARYSIAEIFELFGEEKFRASEARTILELLDTEPGVLATGGGAVLNEEVRKAIAEKSVSVWLRAAQGDLIARLKNSNKRPLLKNGNVEEIIPEFMRRRQPYYEQSNIVIDVVQNSVEQTVQAIIKALYAHLKNDNFGN